MTSLLDVKNLSVYFREISGKSAVCAVKGVNFSVERGEILGIVGESGSGKSVTALSVPGLLPYPKAYHGEGSSVLFKGKELLNSNELQSIRGGNIGFVFQEPMSSLNPLHTIEKQIAENIMLHQQCSFKKARKQVLKLLLLTGIKNAKKRMKAYPFELSGGQRQRIMIAMAIANNPDLLIADEPTTALDVTVQQQILDLLLDLRKKLGMAIIFISHDLRVIRKIADRVCVMKSGCMIECGNTQDVFNNPKCEYTKTLISSHFLKKEKASELKDIVLKVNGLRVFFPLKKNFWGRVVEYVKAVNGVSFDLRRGETLGIVGESGSGKTTLGTALVGMHAYDGKISYFQDDILCSSMKNPMQIVFQDPYNALNPRMNVEDIVGEGLDIRFPKMDKADRRNRIIKVLQDVALDKAVMNKYPHEFSGGQRQRIAIARALILEPQLLILDEPTSALDVTIQAQILTLLLDIQKKYGLSYIFISHDMNAIRTMADKIAVMKDGKFVELDSCENIFSSSKHKYTKDLIAAAE